MTKTPAEMTTEQKAHAFDAIFSDFELGRIRIYVLEQRVKKLEMALLQTNKGKTDAN